MGLSRVERYSMYNDIKGSRYEATKDLDIAEVAKLVRKDIKSDIPTIKTSVRVQRYSMGCSINVEMLEYSIVLKLHYRKQIRKILDSYNYDKSDVMTDYFDYKFAGLIN